MPLPKNRFISLWLVSAAAVVAVRILIVSDIGYDLSLQLEAARNFSHGHGLATYSGGVEPVDLAIPNQLVTLTYFPAGYSIAASALTGMGARPLVTVKILAAIGTMFGWWGWARLAFVFMGSTPSRFSRWTAVAIAIATPLFFTPPWTGTDIFLWAAVPWFLQFLVPGPEEGTGKGTRSDLAAGAIAGFSVLLRYQALFLVAYAPLLIVCQCSPRFKAVPRRLGLFFAGLIPPLAVQIYLNYFISTGRVVLGGVHFDVASLHRGELLWNGFVQLTSASFPLISWLPPTVTEFVIQFGEHHAPWLSAVTIVFLVSLPFVFSARFGYRSIDAASHDVRVAAVGLFVVIPLCLWICGLGDAVYVGVTRYYIPVVPLGILAAYALAFPGENRHDKLKRYPGLIAMAYIAGYLSMAVISFFLLGVAGDRGAAKRARLLGEPPPHHWFSTAPNYERSPARKYVMGLLKAEPNTILVTNREQWFYADPLVDQSRLRRVQHFHAHYVTGPARVLVFAIDPYPVADDVLFWFHTFGYAERMHYFEGLPDLHLLRRFSKEQIKVLEMRVPDGGRVELNWKSEESQGINGDAGNLKGTTNDYVAAGCIAEKGSLVDGLDDR